MLNEKLHELVMGIYVAEHSVFFHQCCGIDCYNVARALEVDIPLLLLRDEDKLDDEYVMLVSSLKNSHFLKYKEGDKWWKTARQDQIIERIRVGINRLLDTIEVKPAPRECINDQIPETREEFVEQVMALIENLMRIEHTIIKSLHMPDNLPMSENQFIKLVSETMLMAARCYQADKTIAYHIDKWVSDTMCRITDILYSDEDRVIYVFGCCGLDEEYNGLIRFTEWLRRMLLPK